MNYFRKIVLIATIAIIAFPSLAMENLPDEIYFIIFDLNKTSEEFQDNYIELGKLAPVSKKMYFACDSFGSKQIKHIFGDSIGPKPEGMNRLEFFVVNINIKFFLKNKKAKEGNKANKWLRNGNFQKAKLYNLSFVCSNLSNADFTGAKLDHIDFTEANLYQAKFCQSIMDTRVSFRGANLQETDFSWARLSLKQNIDIGLEKIYIPIEPDFKGADFTNANLKGIIISGFCKNNYGPDNKLEKVNLTGASLRFSCYIEDNNGYLKKPITLHWLRSQGAYWDDSNPPSI